MLVHTPQTTTPLRAPGARGDRQSENCGAFLFGQSFYLFRQLGCGIRLTLINSQLSDGFCLLAPALGRKKKSGPPNRAKNVPSRLNGWIISHSIGLSIMAIALIMSHPIAFRVSGKH